jgi:hypothetical protein
MKRLIGGFGGALAITLTGLSVLALTVGLASASSVHLSRDRVTFTDNGLTLSSTGRLTGLGNGDILVEIAATGSPTATCTNPAGATQPPGQNPAEVTLRGTQSIPASEVKNGNVTFNVTSQPPASPVPGAPDCPGSKWTETITDVAFTSATVSVTQGGGVVLTAGCTFTPATTNNVVTVSCTTA